MMTCEALKLANDMFGLVHNDIHSNNIIVRHLTKKMWIAVSDDMYYYSDLIPVIIDYGQATISADDRGHTGHDPVDVIKSFDLKSDLKSDDNFDIINTGDDTTIVSYDQILTAMKRYYYGSDIVRYSTFTELTKQSLKEGEEVLVSFSHQWLPPRPS